MTDSILRVSALLLVFAFTAADCLPHIDVHPSYQPASEDTCQPSVVADGRR